MINRFLSSAFTAQLPKAICNVLLHSLATGVVIAALAGLVILLTKKASASTRYLLLCSLLILFVALTTADFYRELQQPIAPEISSATLVNNVVKSYSVAPIRSFSLSTAAALFNQSSGWIFTLWLIICLFKSIKLTRELLYIKRARAVGTRSITNALQVKLELYKEKLDISRFIALLESEFVKVPVTFGYLRPVILLPVGIILQLSQEQIESIILHELAHIKRRDYLVGLLQSIVEMLFFFNPAIWWLSALIREEREACCDELVLSEIRDKRDYLTSLIAFQTIECTPQKLAIGLSFGKDQLLNRLKRIINKETPKLNAAQKISLLFCVTTLFVFALFSPLSPVVRTKSILLKPKLITMSTPVGTIKTVTHTQSDISHSDTTAHHYHSASPASDTILPKAVIKVTPKSALLSQPEVLKAALLSVEPEPKFKIENAGYKHGGNDNENDKQRIRGVIAMLIEAKVVNTANDIQWFGLSDTELIVNGQKQPSDLQKQAKDKYGVGPNNGLYYGPVRMTGTGSFFDKRDI